MSGFEQWPDAVSVVEVSPRDGLQNEAQILPLEDKVALIERAVTAGARRIEAMSFVNERRVPQMAGAEELASRLPRHPDVTYSALILNRRGAERAACCDIGEVNLVVVASDTLSQRNQGRELAAMLDHSRHIASDASDWGLRVTATIATAFGCPFEGEIDTTRVCDIACALADMGVTEIALADTIGAATPRDVIERVSAVRTATADAVPLRLHLHDTRNTAVANAVAGMTAGVATLDASIGGAGGCPFSPGASGNLPTEDLVYCLRGMGIDTGLDLESLIDTGRWLGERLDRLLPAAVGRAPTFPPARHTLEGHQS